MTKNFEIINAYSRKQALEDNVLHDISDMAKEAGFKIPVAVTHNVWSDYIEWTELDNTIQTFQDQKGRLWDVLFMAMLNINNSISHKTDRVIYTINCIPKDNKSTLPKKIKLKLMIHGGDKGEPVITIMLPEED